MRSLVSTIAVGPRFGCPGRSDRKAVCWLRRAVALPDGTDTSRLAVTLGSIGESYELFANGVKIGTAGGFSDEGSQIARPRTFAIPAEAAGTDGKLLIAVRLWKLQTAGTAGWFLFNAGRML